MASNSDLLNAYASLRRSIALEATYYLKNVNLSLRQFLILRNLGLEGRLPMTELAERCMTDAATISRSICQLVGSGYVKKEQCPEDGRVFHAELTSKGKRALPRLEEIHVGLADRCFSSLNEGEKRLLASILEKVVGNLGTSRKQNSTEIAV